MPLSAVLATPFTAPSKVRRAVTIRPLSETKKPVPLRKSLPVESNTVTRITAGLTLCAICIRGEGCSVCPLKEEAGNGADVAVTDGDCCAIRSGSTLTTAAAIIVRQQHLKIVSRKFLISSPATAILAERDRRNQAAKSRHMSRKNDSEKRA